MDKGIEQADGSCHCGTVKFHVRLTNGLHTARRCTCYYCRMRGAIAVSAELGGLTIVAGQDALSVYWFNTNSAQHYFCSKCGIYTHHQRRSNPHQYGINVACLEGVSPFDFDEVPVLDGVNHPSDTKQAGPQVVGGPMMSAWVELVPQGPSSARDDLPGTICIAGAGNLAFAPPSN